MKRRAFLGALGFAPLLKGLPPLKITDLKAVNANGYIFYRVYTNGGVTGIGEPSPSNGPLNVTFAGMIKPLILGMDAFRIEEIWQKLYIGLYKTRGQSASMAISAVDIALHDLVGKALGVPVSTLLGGAVRDRIRMYASYTSRDRAPVDQAKMCAAAIDEGFSATKIKIAARHGFDADPKFPDHDMVREVRAAIGPKPQFMVDANSGYSVPHAIQIGRMLEKYDTFWFEEPVPFTDYAATARVSAALDLFVAGGEQDHTRYDFQKMIEAGAVDMVQADVTKAGGVSECKKIAAMADAAGLGYTPHDTSHNIGLAACLHMVASTPVCRYAQEFIKEPGGRHILKTPLEPEKGWLTVPTGPGLGIEVDPKFGE